MSGTKQWNEEYARQVMDEWQRSGLSGEQYAKRIGVSGQKLSNWKLRLGLRRRAPRKDKAAVARLLPVRIMQSASSVNLPGPSSLMEVILSDGTRVRFVESCGAAGMQRLLSAARAAMC